MAQGSTIQRTKITDGVDDAFVNSKGSLQISEERVFDIVQTLEAILFAIQELIAQQYNIDAEPMTVIASADASAKYAPFSSDSRAYEANRTVKIGSGILYGFTGFSSKTSAQWIQVFDGTTLPADGAIPIALTYAAATSPFFLDFGEKGKYFPQGIILCNSSTGPTKTIGSADCWFNATYK